jgi:hypothetical protein
MMMASSWLTSRSHRSAFEHSRGKGQSLVGGLNKRLSLDLVEPKSTESGFTRAKNGPKSALSRNPFSW